MNYIVPLASTSYIIEFPVYDSSSSTGALLAGLTFESASLVAYYDRWGAAGSATAISLVTMTKGTYASGGFVAVDGTNQAGRYQLCIPDAALASGANGVTVTLQGASNMVPVTLEITLLDLASPTDIVTQLNTTGLSNVASAAITDINSAVLAILGTPADTDLSTDIANVATSVSTIEAGNGMPLEEFLALGYFGE